MDPQNAPTDEETQSVPKAYPETGKISEANWEFYWRQVAKTLHDVFDAGTKSRAAFKRLKSRVEESHDPNFQASVYHLDPFQVAADLAGVEEVTAEQKEKYGDVLRNLSKEPAPSGYDPALVLEVTPDQTSRAVPDDPRPHKTVT